MISNPKKGHRSILMPPNISFTSYCAAEWQTVVDCEVGGCLWQVPVNWSPGETSALRHGSHQYSGL